MLPVSANTASAHRRRNPSTGTANGVPAMLVPIADLIAIVDHAARLEATHSTHTVQASECRCAHAQTSFTDPLVPKVIPPAGTAIHGQLNSGTAFTGFVVAENDIHRRWHPFKVLLHDGTVSTPNISVVEWWNEI